MTTASIVSILVDFLAVAFLIYGFINEEKVIEFEMNLRRIVLGNIRRAVRMRNRKKAAVNASHICQASPKRHECVCGRNAA